MTTMTAIQTLRNYVNGERVKSEATTVFNVENPSTGEVIGRTPMSTAREASLAIEAAHDAYRGWRQTPASQRVQPLFKLAAIVRENEERVARILSEEMGKSLPDARAELKRTIENIETACGMPVLQQGTKLIGASMGIDGEVLRLPRGVYTMIAPFNFPAMVPFWFLPYAIATGNTFVVKPSERVPHTMQLLTDMIARTGLPRGVYNLVNGGIEVADTFMTHPKVVGVSMVGSTRVAKIVAETCAKHGKRSQAMGGAKNHLVVMPDAQLDNVIRNMITSCYGCAGQRCMASSAIVAVGNDTYRTVCKEFVQASQEVIVANPLDPNVADEPMVMGPVISAQAKEFVLSMIDKGIAEGATLAYDGRNVSVPGCEKGYFIGPVVFTDVQPGMEIHKTEIFGPVLVILKADTLDGAIRIVNEHRYGNGASIYTQNGHWANKFKLEAMSGMIGINVGIPAPVAHLPFGGMKDSVLSETKPQGTSVIRFYTEEKVITERYWPEE